MKYSQSKMKHAAFPLGITSSQCKLWAEQDKARKIIAVKVTLKGKEKTFVVKKNLFLEAFKEAETFLNKNLVLTKTKGKNNSKNQG